MIGFRDYDDKSKGSVRTGNILTDVGISFSRKNCAPLCSSISQSVRKVTTGSRKCGACHNQCMFDVADPVLHVTIIIYLKLDQTGFRTRVDCLPDPIEILTGV